MGKICQSILFPKAVVGMLVVSAYKGSVNDVCHFLNQVQECQNLAFILWIYSLIMQLFSKEHISFRKLMFFIL